MFIIKQILVFRRFHNIAKSDYQLRHVCLSIRPRRTNRFPLEGFLWNFIFENFSKLCWENSSFVKNLTRKSKPGNLHEDYYTYMIISRWILFRMKSVSEESCRENQNTHFFFFFRKSYILRHNVKKYYTARQDTDDNKTNEHCMLGIQGY